MRSNEAIEQSSNRIGRRTRLALTCAVGVLLASPFAYSDPVPQVPGTWSVDDGGNRYLAKNISSAATYRVTNNGPDEKVTVRAYNASGGLVTTLEIEKGTSGDLGVPAGGKLLLQDTDVSDPNPSNTDGAAGTYETV